MLTRLAATAATLIVLLGGMARAADLPSWNDGVAKASILDVVAVVTSEGGAEFVPASERIAVFDNDGTLWVEQPL